MLPSVTALYKMGFKMSSVYREVLVLQEQKIKEILPQSNCEEAGLR